MNPLHYLLIALGVSSVAGWLAWWMKPTHADIQRESDFWKGLAMARMQQITRTTKTVADLKRQLDEATQHLSGETAQPA